MFERVRESKCYDNACFLWSAANTQKRCVNRIQSVLMCRGPLPPPGYAVCLLAWHQSLAFSLSHSHTHILFTHTQSHRQTHTPSLSHFFPSIYFIACFAKCLSVDIFELMSNLNLRGWSSQITKKKIFEYSSRVAIQICNFELFAIVLYLHSFILWSVLSTYFKIKPMISNLYQKVSYSIKL
jgi:hypothetical protein